jgi:xanthine dehydrogenase accessory factor
MPLKYPTATEPVIPENTDGIIVVWGPHGLGKPAREVCHRLELVLDCLGIDGDTPITREHVTALLEKGYLTPLRRRHPHADITVFPPL